MLRFFIFLLLILLASITYRAVEFWHLESQVAEAKIMEEIQSLKLRKELLQRHLEYLQTAPHHWPHPRPDRAQRTPTSCQFLLDYYTGLRCA